MSIQSKKTLVIGASTKADRFSNKAVRSLKKHGYPVLALGARQGKIEDVEIMTGQPELNEIDTITVYLSVENQRPMYQYLLSLHPKRIIFNPGAENAELEKLANENGIETMDACTLVMLSTEQY